MSITYPPLLSRNLTYVSGFTLIELMLTIAIAAVVMGLAIPSFNTAIKNNRLTTQANDLVTSLNFARSEAVKRGHQVTLCKSNDGLTCVTAGNWAQGWIVFADQNNNFVLDGGEAILRVQGAAQAQINMVGTAQIANVVSYRSNGQVAPFANHGITICDDRVGAFGRTIGIGSLGRPSTAVGVACP